MAIWSVYILAPSITQTKARYRPRGWFSEREEKILVNRLLRDDPAKSTMHNRQAMTAKLYWQALCEYDTWPLYLISLIARIPAFVPDVYFTLILRGLRFTTTQSNLLTIPPYIAYLFAVRSSLSWSSIHPSIIRFCKSGADKTQPMSRLSASPFWPRRPTNDASPHCWVNSGTYQS